MNPGGSVCAALALGAGPTRRLLLGSALANLALGLSFALSCLWICRTRQEPPLLGKR